MGKFIAYCKNDGFKNAVKYTFSAVAGKFYRHSETEFVKIDLNGPWDILSTPNYEIKPVSLKELPFMDFPRLQSQPWQQWFDIGSELYVGFYEGKPATYSWIHYAYHDMGDLGRFILKSDECWVGPTFVDNKYRGKGLNKIQMLQNFRDAKAKTAFGSFNTENTASKVSCLKVGFEIYGKATFTKKLFAKKIEIEGDFLKEHLKQL